MEFNDLRWLGKDSEVARSGALVCPGAFVVSEASIRRVPEFDVEFESWSRVNVWDKADPSSTIQLYQNLII